MANWRSEMGRKIDILSEARGTRDTEVALDGSGFNVGLNSLLGSLV